jgi:aspartate 1-decarboxylase
MSYALFSPAELLEFKPRLVFVDERNHILRLDETEAAEETFHSGGSEG